MKLNLKKICDLVFDEWDLYFPDREFVIAKNRLFVLPCNKDTPELLGIIKVNSSTALMLDFDFPDGPFADKNVYHPTCTAEIQNGSVTKDYSYYDFMWPQYTEYKSGVMHGYYEDCFQQTLRERGFMKNGVKEGWWEYGNKYTDPDELVKQVEHWHEIGDKFEEGHYLKTPVYRPAECVLYQNDGSSKSYYITDFDYEFSDEYMKSPVDVKETLAQGNIYYEEEDYAWLSYETYLKITNLPRLRKTGMNKYQKELPKYQKDLREAAKPRQPFKEKINPREPRMPYLDYASALDYGAIWSREKQLMLDLLDLDPKEHFCVICCKNNCDCIKAHFPYS